MFGIYDIIPLHALLQSKQSSYLRDLIELLLSPFF